MESVGKSVVSLGTAVVIVVEPVASSDEVVVSVGNFVVAVKESEDTDEEKNVVTVEGVIFVDCAVVCVVIVERAVDTVE